MLFQSGGQFVGFSLIIYEMRLFENVRRITSAKKYDLSVVFVPQTGLACTDCTGVEKKGLDLYPDPAMLLAMIHGDKCG